MKIKLGTKVYKKKKKIKIKSYKKRKIKIKTKPKKKSYSPPKSVFNLLVVGDSILWGQGLRLKDKMYTKIGDHIKKTKKITVHTRVNARSGAIIGRGKNRYKGKIPKYGEVPFSYPTIIQQVADAKKWYPQNGAEVDLVLVDGGINDVNVNTIMNPLKPLSSLESQCKTYCYFDMHHLLTNITKTFKNAFVIVTGYFSVVTNDTDFSKLSDGLNSILGAPIITDAVGKKKIVRRWQFFRIKAHKNIRRAVEDTNSNLPTMRVFFVDPKFGSKNALFASNSYLFGLKRHWTGAGVSAVDPMVNVRIPECKKGSLLKYHTCTIASVAHPNEIGENQYVNEIKKVL